MNIGNVSNSGGVDRGAERSARVDGRAATPSSAAAAGDRAAISADGRGAAAAFEARVATARAEPNERDEHVARAMTRLLGGELDAAAVYRDVAERMLGQGFKTV